MIKKSVVFCIILILVFIFTAYLTIAQQTEDEKVEDAYNWLMKEVRGKWDNLNTKEHIFSLLALKCDTSFTNPGKAALNNKAYIGQSIKCWGSGSKPSSETLCLVTETALGKVVLDELNENTTKITNWLLEQKKFFKNIDWYMQLDVDRDYSAECEITYEGGRTNVTINEDKTLSNLDNTACFTIYDQYWLKINKDCYEKPFKVRCVVSDNTKLFRVNFLYKKLNKPEWHVSPELWEEASGHVIEAHIESYCLTNPGGACDYEGTAWAVYALKQTEYSETYSGFIPYLVIEGEETTNAKYFPEAFLYLAGIENYGYKVEADQSIYGFWMTQNTQYGQFYDTALGGMTGKGNLGSEYGGARYYLTTTPGFREQGGYRYWKCSESGSDACKDLRDTAFLLWVYWPYLCPGIGVSQNCEDQGYGYRCNESCILGEEIEVLFICPPGLKCCQLVGIGDISCSDAGGTCKIQCDDQDEFEIWEIICDDPLEYCCKKYEDATCTESGGYVCDVGFECTGTTVYTLDGDCCLGSCVQAGVYDYCIDMIPSAINCDFNQICINENTWLEIPFVQTTYEDRCCPYPGKCVQDVECSTMGEECSITEECYGTIEETKDVKNCCVGQCLKSCSNQDGEICAIDEKCTGISKYSIEYPEDKRCCVDGECKKPKSFWWLWLIIVILVIGGGIAFYFFKFKKKRPKKKPGIFGGITPIIRPRRPIGQGPRPLIKTQRRMIMQPRPGVRPGTRPRTAIPVRPGAKHLPARPMARALPKAPIAPRAPITKPTLRTLRRKGKTETELAKTLKKLKKMTTK